MDCSGGLPGAQQPDAVRCSIWLQSAIDAHSFGRWLWSACARRQSATVVEPTVARPSSPLIHPTVRAMRNRAALALVEQQGRGWGTSTIDIGATTVNSPREPASAQEISPSMRLPHRRGALRIVFQALSTRIGSPVPVPAPHSQLPSASQRSGATTRSDWWFNVRACSCDATRGGRLRSTFVRPRSWSEHSVHARGFVSLTRQPPSLERRTHSLLCYSCVHGQLRGGLSGWP